MLLCDIGNTSYHFYDGTRDYKAPVEAFEPAAVSEPVYFICVNPSVSKRVESLSNWHNLRPMIDWEHYYPTMGIDRVCACEAVSDGVIVDAGSAITVDLVRGGRFVGGFISPGLKALREAYLAVSNALDYSFNFEMQLDKMPSNSRDAVTYGTLGLVVREVRRLNAPVILTGGDAQTLHPLLPDAALEPLLLFRGMTKIIQKAQPC